MEKDNSCSNEEGGGETSSPMEEDEINEVGATAPVGGEAEGGSDEESDSDLSEMGDTPSLGEEEEDSLDDDEIDQLLEEGLPKTKRLKRREGHVDKKGDYNEKDIIVLEENSKNTLEVLPGGWIEVRHSSGMPLYLHRATRICTLAKPYFLGPGSARRHSIPLSAIPCLAYRRHEGSPSTSLKNTGEGEEEPKEATSIPKRKISPPSPPLTDQHGNGGGEKRCRMDIVASVGEVNLEDIKSPDGQSLEMLEEAIVSSSTPTPAASECTSTIATSPGVELGSLPVAKVASAKENHSMHSISPEELRNYCRAVFKFKTVKSKRFKSWRDRRTYTKDQKRLQLQRPTMPDGVKLISFPIHSGGNDGGNAVKEYIMNPQGKSSVCILHEYVQHALRKQPSYDFKELENAATPYSATVVINSMRYGTGYGSSKKQAKADAAKATLEILIPQMKEQLNGTKQDVNGEFDILPYFEPFDLFDIGISKICKNFSEPPPYGLLLTCLQRNFGQEMSSNVKFEMITPGAQSNKFKMEVGEHFVEVQAPNKREGKQLASQRLLAKLHPNIKNFGAFVKLYGNSSIKSVKEKKQEEQQITVLQSKASANSPNWAILSKLKAEMAKLELNWDQSLTSKTQDVRKLQLSSTVKELHALHEAQSK